MIYRAWLALLARLGVRVSPRPDLEKHARVVHDLDRAVRLTQRAFPEEFAGPTGNFVEDVLSGQFEEPRR